MTDLDMFLYVLDGSEHTNYYKSFEPFIHNGKKYESCVKVVLSNDTGRIAIYFDKENGKRIV